jgi:hypothetical protein
MANSWEGVVCCGKLFQDLVALYILDHKGLKSSQTMHLWNVASGHGKIVALTWYLGIYGHKIDP